jgi:ribosomal protein S1
MFSISKIVGVMFTGFVLCVGLSDAEAGPIAMQGDQRSHSQSGEIIKGEVMRVESDHIFIKGENGKDVRMHIDQTTRMSRTMLVEGELIEATVNGDNHALSIDSPDRSSEHTTEPEQIFAPAPR